MREPVEIGETGKAYLRAIRLRGIRSDVAYFDPSAPAPSLDTDQTPEKRNQRDGQTGGRGAGGDRMTGTVPSWVAGTIAAVILIAIAFVVWRFGAGFAVSLNRDARNPSRGRDNGPANAPDWAARSGSFDEILRMKDRRRALVLLTQKALAATVAANGILMQRSWTARDALRHLPAGQRHLDTLRSLVMTSERVQFGDRNVSEAEFQDHASHCRQLLGPGAA